MSPPWKRCTGCGKEGLNFGPKTCAAPRDECRAHRKVVVAKPPRRAHRGQLASTRKPRIALGPGMRLETERLERAARFAARCEGLNPDAVTCSGRAQWQVYAELLCKVYLPAIEHALAGMKRGLS